MIRNGLQTRCSFIFKTYAVGVQKGGLEGECPPRNFPFPALSPDSAGKIRSLGAFTPPPNPHRVNPVIFTTYTVERFEEASPPETPPMRKPLHS
jgi:hypothetical protein